MMRGTIKKIIYIAIVLVIGIYAYFSHVNKKYDSIRVLGNGDNKYFALSVKDNNQEKLSDFIFTTYDKETKKKEKYKFDEGYDSVVNIPILSNSTKACGNWVLTKGADCNKLIGINANTGEAKVLVETDDSKGQYLMNFDLYGDNLVYSYSEDNLTKVEIKNVKTDESQYVGNFFDKNDIPLSIDEDKVALIKNNELYIFDCISNDFTVIKGEKYTGNILIRNNEIYTFKKSYSRNDYSELVKIDLNNKSEKTILKGILGECELNLDGQRLAIDQYFYDLDQDKLYYKEEELNRGYTKGRLVLGDYIKGRNNRFEKIEYNKNCFEYTLGVDRYSSYRIDGGEKNIGVLPDGQVFVTSDKTNKIEKSFDGFNISDRCILWRFVLDNNNLYGFDISKDGRPEITSIDIESGSKSIVKELENSNNTIMNLNAYCNEVMYSSKRDKDVMVKVIDTNDLNEKEYSLPKEENIYNMFFNKEYLVYIIAGDKSKVVVYNRETKEIKTSETEGVEGKYYDILGINEDGFMLQGADTKYKFIDFNFNSKKEFKDYDKAMKYIYK